MKNILVVDDEVAISNILKFILIKNGYNVKIANNGEEALLKIKESPPDLLMIDIMMPKMSGYDVCKKLKEMGLFEKFPIIMLSAKSQKEDFEKAEKIGINYYITKPFSPINVVEKVKKILGG